MPGKNVTDNLFRDLGVPRKPRTVLGKRLYSSSVCPCFQWNSDAVWDETYIPWPSKHGSHETWPVIHLRSHHAFIATETVNAHTKLFIHSIELIPCNVLGQLQALKDQLYNYNNPVPLPKFKKQCMGILEHPDLGTKIGDTLEVRTHQKVKQWITLPL